MQTAARGSSFDLDQGVNHAGSGTSIRDAAVVLGWLRQRRRAGLVDPDKPAARVTVTFTADEATQLAFMAEAWLDQFPPVQVYDAEEIGVWNRATVLRAMRKLDAGLWPKKKRTRKPSASPKGGASL